MLSIQSSNELSSVNVFGSENWTLNVGEQGMWPAHIRLSPFIVLTVGSNRTLCRMLVRCRNSG